MMKTLLTTSSALMFSLTVECSPPSPTASVSITSKNYTDSTSGKVVFIKFFSPWCDHCKELAPAWELLAKDWENDAVGLVGEVNCMDSSEGGGETLCEEFDIMGMPTMLYGDPREKSSMAEYSGGRSYEDLASFARRHLVPICSPTIQDGCDESTKAEIARYFAMVPTGELDEAIRSLEGRHEDAESSFQGEVERMTTTYNAAMMKKELSLARTKSEIRLLREIRKGKSP